MRRSSLRTLLASASLADERLERERIRAERDSKNFASGVGALRDLVPGVVGVVEKTKGKEEAQAEKLRLEGREDDALMKKLAREDALAAAKLKREQDAATAAAAEKKRLEEKADADAKAKRELDIDKEMAEQNQKSFESQDKRDNNKTQAEIEREKIALEREKMNKKGAGAPKTKPIPADEAAKLSRADQALTLIGKVREQKKNFNTGKIATFGREVADNIPGVESIEALDQAGFNKFRSDVDQLRQLTATLYEQGKLAEGDAKRYERMLSSTNLDDKAFDTVLDEMESTLHGMVSKGMDAQEEIGYRVPRKTMGGATAAPTAPRPSAAGPKNPADMTEDELRAELEALGG